MMEMQSNRNSDLNNIVETSNETKGKEDDDNQDNLPSGSAIICPEVIDEK